MFEYLVNGDRWRNITIAINQELIFAHSKGQAQDQTHFDCGFFVKGEREIVITTIEVNAICSFDWNIYS